MKRKYSKILKVNVDLSVCYDLYIKTIIFLLRHTFTPSVTKKITVQNKIRKSFMAIFFPLSGTSSMCRQIKPLAGPAGQLLSPSSFFCLVLFFCASFSFTRS